MEEQPQRVVDGVNPHGRVASGVLSYANVDMTSNESTGNIEWDALSAKVLEQVEKCLPPPVSSTQYDSVAESSNVSRTSRANVDFYYSTKKEQADGSHR